MFRHIDYYARVMFHLFARLSGRGRGDVFNFGMQHNIADVTIHVKYYVNQFRRFCGSYTSNFVILHQLGWLPLQQRKIYTVLSRGSMLKYNYFKEL